MLWRKDVAVLLLFADLVTIQQALHISTAHKTSGDDDVVSLLCATEPETVTTDESTTSGWSNLAATSTDVGLASPPNGYPDDSWNCSDYEPDVERFKDMFNRFSVPGSATELSLCVCSVITNALSIMVHRSKRIVLPTFLIAISSADIVQGLGSSVVQIRFFFNTKTESGTDSIVKVKSIMIFSIGRSVFLSLQRINHIISAFMCLDRFIRLSRPVLSNTWIQKHSKLVLLLVMLFVFASGACESYAIYNERLLVLASGAAKPECTRPEVDNSSSAITVTSTGSWLETVTGNPHAVTKKPLVGYSNCTVDHVTSGLMETTPVLVENATTSPQGTYMNSNRVLGYAESIFQNTSLVNNIITYILMVVMVILTIITVFFLKSHAQKRRQLGVGGSGQRQTRILVTITAVYVIFALPSTSISLIRDLKIWPEFEIGGKLGYLFMILIKVCSMSEQVKNISDFIVFLVMSRTFRTALLSATFLKMQQPSVS